jgi:hypothetical protein
MVPELSPVLRNRRTWFLPTVAASQLLESRCKDTTPVMHSFRAYACSVRDVHECVFTNLADSNRLTTTNQVCKLEPDSH